MRPPLRLCNARTVCSRNLREIWEISHQVRLWKPPTRLARERGAAILCREEDLMRRTVLDPVARAIVRVRTANTHGGDIRSRLFGNRPCFQLACNDPRA